MLQRSAYLLLSTRGMSTKVAVVLSGCGVYDGSEVHESSAVLTHLSRHGAEVSVFAPDKVGDMVMVGDSRGAGETVVEGIGDAVRWGRLKDGGD